MRIIDVNARFGAYPSRHRAATFEQLSTEAEAHQVDLSCVCSTTGIYFNAHEGNAETINAASALPQRLVPVATLNPATTLDPERAIEEIAGAPFKMVRFFPDVQGWPIDFAPFTQLVRHLARRELPIMMTCCRHGDATQIARLVQALEDDKPTVILEDVSFLTLAETIAAMRECSSLLLETHTLRFADGLAAIRDIVGAQRIVFGSGAAAQSLGASLSYLNKSSLTDDEKAQVLGGNAAALLKLG